MRYLALLIVLVSTGCMGSSHNSVMVKVPDVSKEYSDHAVNQLHAVGLQAQITSFPTIRNADVHTNGYWVHHQRPRPGSRAPQGSEVHLVLQVSIKIGPQHTEYPAHATVPKVVGLPADRAIAAVTRRGLRVTLQAAELPLHSLRVVLQSLAPGTTARRSSVVILTLD